MSSAVFVLYAIAGVVIGFEVVRAVLEELDAKRAERRHQPK